MTKVFIGGSRRITGLAPEVRCRIDRIIQRRFPIMIGDANGADKAVQRYLKSRDYDLVEVFCAGERCRNNVGNWPLRVVRTEGVKSGFEFYATKDREMANESSIGFMIWDGRSVGTLLNVLRLLRQHKKVVVYTSPEREFLELGSETDWQTLASLCPPDVLERVLHRAASEQNARSTLRQASLF